MSVYQKKKPDRSQLHKLVAKNKWGLRPTIFCKIIQKACRTNFDRAILSYPFKRGLSIVSDIVIRIKMRSNHNYHFFIITKDKSQEKKYNIMGLRLCTYTIWAIKADDTSIISKKNQFEQIGFSGVLPISETVKNL